MNTTSQDRDNAPLQDAAKPGVESAVSAVSAAAVATPSSTTHAASGASSNAARGESVSPRSQWPLWEVFVRSKAGLDHKHCGSLHAADGAMALQLARDVYTRRQEGTSVWVVRSDQIVTSDPRDKAMLFDPADDKIYRHPTFYALPASVDHM